MLICLLFLLLLSVSGEVHFSVLVKNSVEPQSPNRHYKTHVADFGILLGGLNNLQDSREDFT